MGPKATEIQTDELFLMRLDGQLKMSHPLIKLANTLDWSAVEKEFAGYFVSTRGRPALPPRLVAGLLYLQHAFSASDEAVVSIWLENPYWQYFTGETYLQTELPIDPSSLTRWRKRLGEAGVELLLSLTINAAKQLSVVQEKSLDRVIVDTTVMPKAIAHPTDSALLETARQHMVAFAKEHGLALRQNYNKEAPRLAIQVGRYAHARQYKRIHGVLRKLKSRVGRIHRELIRQFEQVPSEAEQSGFELLQKVERLLTQKPKDKNKLYSLHAPEAECISKGKAKNPYEFGVKVSIATTLNEGLVVGMRSMPGNPYDGHTLHEALEQASILTERRPKIAIVDKGYKGAAIDGVQILRSGQRTQSKTLKKMIKRRSSIEPAIGHMKMDGRLGRNPLKGGLGDALHAVLCGAGHNLRLILRKLRLFCSLFLSLLLRNILATLKQNQLAHQAAL